jgi:dsRNA-specific ribonuclease
MERLELLGDSVLKYAVSCHLFLKFPDKDEGELTSSRTDIISNAALYGLGIEHKIQVNCISSWASYTTAAFVKLIFNIMTD